MKKEEFLNLLDKLYFEVIGGFESTSETIEEMVNGYLSKADNAESAIDMLAADYVEKCGVIGMTTNMSVSSDLSFMLLPHEGNVVYHQMRMMIAIALIRGYDVSSDNVRNTIKDCFVDVLTNTKKPISALPSEGSMISGTMNIGMTKVIAGRAKDLFRDMTNESGINSF